MIGEGENLTQACAHRGDWRDHRENTIPAIRAALSAKTKYVEIDVRLSSDGQVVVIHDSTLERLWGVAQSVSQMSWEEISNIGQGEVRIPRLAEVIDLFRGSSATLLIDMDALEPAKSAWEVVQLAGVAVAWCGDIRAMGQIRSLDATAEIWMPWNEEQLPTALDLLELKPKYINSYYLHMNAQRIKELHSLGVLVSLWTIDDAASMRWAIEIGADSVTSNNVELLQSVLREFSSHEETLLPQEIDVEAALCVARELARWAIHYARSTDPGEIARKMNPADLVTEVDLAIERKVRAVILERFPTHNFIGEEFGGSTDAQTPCWYLDPVDGTTNFANQIPWNAFSLALAIGEKTIVAVVADPWRSDIFEAVSGGGAKLNNLPLQLDLYEKGDDRLSGGVVLTELDAHLAWPGMLQMLTALGERHCTMRIMGSGTMTMVGIAAGRGVGAIIGKFGAVDHLAAALIVKEAGGIVLDEKGAVNIFPSAGGIMAAIPGVADELFDLWKSAREEAREEARE